MSSIQAASIDPGTLPVFSAFCKIRDTMKAMEWSADLEVTTSQAQNPQPTLKVSLI